DRIFLFGWRMCPWVGREGWAARPAHRACTERRQRPAHRAPTYLRLGPKLQLTACPADGALPTQAILPNWLLPPRPAHQAPRLHTSDARAALHSPVIVPACRWRLTAPYVARARIADGSGGRARPAGRPPTCGLGRRSS